ncbi:hypothetical protein C0992_008437 [Termitomyces sp. T32_za158]|nr:hypothetical protein C0992_008437 [Termitomyces sp. T32_za158]
MAAEPDSKTVFTVQEYLSGVCLPTFRKSSTLWFTTAPHMRALSWPEYPELQRPRGTRPLREIERSPNIKFISLAKNYFSSMQPIEFNAADYVGKDCPLRLASPRYVTYETDDIMFLKSVDNEQKFVTLMQDYVLDTVSESLRAIRRHTLDSPQATALRFKEASHLCTAHHARWDIFALPGTPDRPFPFFVFVVSPEEFGIQDMMDFTDPRWFENANGNQLNTPSKMYQTLWAVISDTCKGRGRFFAVTNYIRWAFGELSPAGTMAYTTYAFESTLMKVDGTSTHPLDLGLNTIQMLTFWVDHALKHS